MEPGKTEALLNSGKNRLGFHFLCLLEKDLQSQISRHAPGKTEALLNEGKNRLAVKVRICRLWNLVFVNIGTSHWPCKLSCPSCEELFWVKLGLICLKGRLKQTFELWEKCAKAVKWRGRMGCEELRHYTLVNSKILNNLTCQQLLILGWILRRVGKLYNWKVLQ